MATTEVTGTEATIKKIKEITGKTEAELKTIVKKAAYTVEAVAKEKCPVITGTLRRSIHAQGKGDTYSYFDSYTKKTESGTLTGLDLDEFTYVVGTNKTYASSVENRKHYLEAGLKAAQKDFPELIEASIVKVAK